MTEKPKKINIKQKRANYFIEGKFNELIESMSVKHKIDSFKEKNTIDYQNNFYLDYTESFLSIYSSKGGFVIPQEEVAEKFFAYSQTLAIFLLLQHNVPIEFSYTRLIRSYVISKLDEKTRMDLEQKFLSYFVQNIKDSKEHINNLILFIYIKHKTKINSDIPEFNDIIKDIISKPLTTDNVVIKNNLFTRMAKYTPEFAKQFIPKMDEALTFSKNINKNTLEGNNKHYFNPVSIINEIFSSFEDILGEEGLLKYVRLNNQADIFYSNLKKVHFSQLHSYTRNTINLIYKLKSPNKITYEEHYNIMSKKDIFPNFDNEEKKGNIILLSENSFFNKKMNMPLTKLKKYFLLLKKTGELEHIKNNQINVQLKNVLDYSFSSNDTVLPLFEKIAFFEQFGINPTVEIIQNAHSLSTQQIIYLKEDYLMPMINYLKENKIETIYTTELLDSFKEKLTIELSKKLAKIDKKLKSLMVNTNNFFKIKLL